MKKIKEKDILKSTKISNKEEEQKIYDVNLGQNGSHATTNSLGIPKNKHDVNSIPLLGDSAETSPDNNLDVRAKSEIFDEVKIEEMLNGDAIFGNGDLDMLNLIFTLKKAMRSVHIWKLKGEKNGDFGNLVEEKLFMKGKVALVKMPDGIVRPFDFTYNFKDCDVYKRPRRIRLVSPIEKKFNGLYIGEGDFHIIYNNSQKASSIVFVWNRLKQVMNAMIGVDNAQKVSMPKYGIGEDVSDTTFEILNKNYGSNNPFIPLGNGIFNVSNQVQDLTQEDRTEGRITVFQHQLSLLLKFLGFKGNSGGDKKERQTELEVAKQDEFGMLLFKDMEAERIRGAERASEVLGNTITYELDMPDEQQKEELNGEENKKKVKNAAVKR